MIMKAVGTVLAIILLVTVIAAIIYGILGGYKLLVTRWDVLGDVWKAGLIILAAILILCTLFLSVSIRSHAQKHGLASTGKVIAYNEFIRWYSDLKSQTTGAVELKSFKAIRNQLVLWGTNPVVKQTNLLVDFIQNDQDELDQIMTQAEQVLGEIKRELGYRSHRSDRDII